MARKLRRSTLAEEISHAFVDGFPDRGPIHVADAFTPDASTAETARTLQVRAGFMEALLRDPRVVRLLASWITQLAGKQPGRRLVLKPKGSLSRLILGELKLAWPWLPVEIADVYHRMIQLREADPVAALAPPVTVGVAAPELTLTFATRVGETTEQAWARLLGLCADVRAEFDRAEKRLSRGWVAKDGARLRAWGRWYYEARVADQPRKILAIAEENHRALKHPKPFMDCDCRKLVREGIKEAGRLLGLGAFTLRSPGGKQGSQKG